MAVEWFVAIGNKCCVCLPKWDTFSIVWSCVVGKVSNGKYYGFALLFELIRSGNIVLWCVRDISPIIM